MGDPAEQHWRKFANEAREQAHAAGVDWARFAEACEAIVGMAAGEPDVIHRLYPILLRHIQMGPRVVPQLRRDVREIWEARRG